MLHRRFNPNAPLWGPFWNNGVVYGERESEDSVRRSMLVENACLGSDAPVGELGFADPLVEPTDGDQVMLRFASGYYSTKYLYRVRSRGPGGDIKDIPYLTCHWATFPLENLRGIEAMATCVMWVRFPGWSQPYLPQPNRVDAARARVESEARRRTNEAHRLAIEWILRNKFGVPVLPGRTR